MSVQTNASTLAPLFGAMADPTRLALMDRLSGDQPLSIAQLADGLEMSHQGVTKHLKVLEAAGLVQFRRRGREKQYVGDPQQLHEAQQYLNHVSAQWDAALDRLKSFVETRD